MAFIRLAGLGHGSLTAAVLAVALECFIKLFQGSRKFQPVEKVIRAGLGWGVEIDRTQTAAF